MSRLMILLNYLFITSEYLFSEENLCMDTFIRSYMDIQGNVPLGVVCSYQNVAYFNIPPNEVFAKLIALQNATGGAGVSVGLEIDEANELMRRKEKWEMVSEYFNYSCLYMFLYHILYSYCVF